jgi:hypothetical protein
MASGVEFRLEWSCQKLSIEQPLHPAFLSNRAGSSSFSDSPTNAMLCTNTMLYIVAMLCANAMLCRNAMLKYPNQLVPCHAK